jgi:hypothetical protein
MSSLQIVEDYDECRGLWNRIIPRHTITDLWEVRNCFHKHYQNQVRFVVKKTQGRITGLLPLCWIEETKCHGIFPGETWQGKTWLEQNRIYACDEFELKAMLAHCPGPYHLRYVNSNQFRQSPQALVDEIGYLFRPHAYGYRMENYYAEFTGKSLKQMRREIARLETYGARFRYDRFTDIELMLGLSLMRYGANSYFYDPRFVKSFLDLAAFLADKGWLKVVTLLLDGQVAAVDMGCVYQGVYTLLAGGTHQAWPGAAKMINLHHMELACGMRIKEVDFLCGDFNWKKNFHLIPRPLYQISSASAEHTGTFTACAQAV